MKSTSIKTLLVSISTLCVVLPLVGSIGLHAIQIAHIHPGHQDYIENSHQHDTEHESGEFLVLGEYMHASDKKLFLSVLPAILLSVASLALIYGSFAQFIVQANLRFLLLLQRKRVFWIITSNYLWLLFARGILNPKLY